MSRLLLGTRNPGKVREIRDLLADLPGLDLVTYADCPFSEVEETGKTFLENALLKARSLAIETGLPVLAEDAGLEVASLGGAPGVLSARFAGAAKNDAQNNQLLLAKLRDTTDRTARFIAVAVLELPDGQTFVTTGVLRGRIAHAQSGSDGFGYDPLFVPDGETRTLAEMPLEEKNRWSHRKHAITRMRSLLVDLIQHGALSR